MDAPRLIVGIQPVREALRAHGRKLSSVLVDAAGGARLSALARFAEDSGVAIERVARGRIDKLSKGVRHQGVAAFAPPLALHDLDALAPEPATLLVALDGITDPHNFGATIRSAVALGATGIVWGEHHAAPLTPATFRASAGAVEHATLYQVRSLRGALDAMNELGLMTVVLDASAATTLDELQLCGPTMLVIGAEDSGASKGVRRAGKVRASLPMSGPMASFNASVAAAVALYEVWRQRRVSAMNTET